jgi:hypothetical protein
MSKADDVARVRDYARVEGDIAVPLIKLDLGLPKHRIVAAIAELVRMGTVRETAPPVRGRDGGPAIYSYVREPVPDNRPRRPAQLEAAEHEPAADLAMATGQTVALTGKARGWSDTPMGTRKRQLAGHRVRRKRNGT